MTQNALHEFEIDLADAPDDLRTKEEQTQEAMQELLSTVSEEYGDFTNAPTDLEQKAEELKLEEMQYKKTRNRIGEYIDDVLGEDTTFVFRELTTGQAMSVQSVIQNTQDQGGDLAQAAEAAGMMKLLEEMAVETPDAVDDISYMPRQVGEWVFEQVNDEVMGVTDAGLGNWSPQMELDNFESS